MLLTTRYAYAVETKLPRRRDSQTTMVWDTLPVEVAEVAGTDAPIACWAPILGEKASGRMALRSMDGDLYRPVHVGAGKEIGRLSTDDSHWRGSPCRYVDEAALRDLVLTLAWKPGIGGVMMTDKTVDDVPNANAALPGRVVSTNQAEREAACVESYSKLRLVDGILHVQSEPFVIEVDLLAGARIGIALRDDGFSMVPPAHRFQLNEFDKALELYVENGGDPSKAEWARPEILDAASFGDDLMHDNVRRTADLLLNAFDRGYGRDAGPRLASLPRTALRGFAALRDGMKGDDATVLGLIARFADDIREVGLCEYYAAKADALLQRCRREGVQFDDPLANDLEILGGLR